MARCSATVERNGGELAPARVHELRRWSRRVGEERWRSPAVLRDATSGTSGSGRRRVATDVLMPTILRLQPRFNDRPTARAPSRRLGTTPIGSSRTVSICRKRSARTAPASCGLRCRRGNRSPDAGRVRRKPRARLAGSGDEPRHHRQGQPAEHARSSSRGSTTRPPVAGAESRSSA